MRPHRRWLFIVASHTLCKDRFHACHTSTPWFINHEICHKTVNLNSLEINHDHFLSMPSPNFRLSSGSLGYWTACNNFKRYCTLPYCVTELIRLWPRSVDFSNFGAILTSWNGSNLGLPGISWGTHGGNSLKFCMLMYLNHLNNWSVSGHGLLIFVILALFWLKETGQIWSFRAFPGERMQGVAWNMVCYCILTTYRYD